MSTILLNAYRFSADHRLVGRVAMALIAATLIAVSLDLAPAFAGGAGVDG